MRSSVRALLSVLVCVLTVAAACAPPPSVPTCRIERRPFHHRVTAEGTLEAAKATSLTVPTEVRRRVRLAWLAAEGTRVEAGDVVARFDPGPMEERLREGRADLASATLKVEKSEIEGAVELRGLDTEHRIASLEVAHAESFRKVDEEVFSRHDILEDQIDEKLAGERRDHAASAQERQRSLGQTELEILAIEQRKARLDIERAADGLEALEVRAPHAGLLRLVRDWSGEPLAVGSEMWRGQQIAEIPDLSLMEAEVFVLEADAGGLAVGQSATIVVESAPGTVHRAEVSRVDTVAKPRQRGSPVQYFGVTLELERTDPAAMKPGQRVRATLELADLEAALVVPRQAVVLAGGESWVKVRQGGELVPRKVTIGASSIGLLVISEGLAEGEEIALHPPADLGEGAPREPIPGPPAAGGGGER